MKYQGDIVRKIMRDDIEHDEAKHVTLRPLYYRSKFLHDAKKD